MHIRTERVSIAEGAHSFGGYLARPADDMPRPGVLVFMEIFGINPHIRAVTERLATAGYVAMAPDFFHRTGPGIDLGYDQPGLEEGRKHLRALRQSQLLEDIDAARAFFDARADVLHGSYGAVGFCVGGHVAYLAATTGHFAATAALYGGGIASTAGFGGEASPLSRARSIRGHILFLFGGKDALIPEADVHAIGDAMREGGVDHEVIVYEGASHGFFCDLRPSYDARAAADAWQRISTLFAHSLQGR
jgi:carboxymethylenebutenolidase